MSRRSEADSRPGKPAPLACPVPSRAFLGPCLQGSEEWEPGHLPSGQPPKAQRPGEGS